ncbi:hypothetical protein [Adhaeretor mobilis]|uniref:PEP-CTERM protein-sorting domain-containing protein n=1 Tax=Adhaeretor mobilis TaxID=1930276 RepID=A0A517N358_9BACT|nr:hypothetical protein [Adhaeretor mobilis]QDT01571.1 hypothetical protein HG15A2_49180 [Adhaeretor mobilis]
MPSTLHRLQCIIFAAVILCTAQALAAVTFFGSVNPDPPGDGNVESTLTIGLDGDDDTDFRGYVQIDGGSQIEYDALILGDEETYRGDLLIAGSLTPGLQARLTLEESGSSSVPTVQIGRLGVGNLTVTGGGSLVLSNSLADLSIGVDTSGVGTMTVTGQLSLVVVPDTHTVGDDGIGHMEVLDGAMVLNSDTTATAVVGRNASATGSVLVDGAGSIWQIQDNLTIGLDGVGSVTISNLGLVDVDRLGAVTTIGASGSLELDGGTFAGANVTLNGTLGGSGLVRGTITSSADALIDVGTGQLLRFTDDVSNQGSVRVRGGEAVFLAGFDNLTTGSQSAPGRVTLESGRVRFSEPLANGGVIAVASGTNHIHGEITNTSSGTIVVASDAVGTFYDSVEVGSGSLELLAGANGLFLADLTFSSGSSAALQVGDADTGPAQVHVSGSAELAGDLDVTLAGGFSPSSGDSFPLLLAAEGVSGTFDSLSLPTLDTGLLWGLDYGANNVVLSVLTALAADFDLDGRVDAADLGVWQAAYGVDDSADANDDGNSDGFDFLTWQQQAGSSSSTISTRAIPEPSSIMLLGMFAAACGLAARPSTARPSTYVS